MFVALHMHAGDGNVHTNIPVNSDNYEMLQDAHHAVARIMRLARSLDGVISGEHGIGTDKASGWFVDIAVACTGIVVAAVFWRLLDLRRLYPKYLGASS